VGEKKAKGECQEVTARKWNSTLNGNKNLISSGRKANGEDSNYRPGRKNRKQ